jgi:hypothetical protein
MYTIGLFLDMSKAFDSINHETLLKKMDYYGIRGVALKWLNSYLTNREIKVNYKNVLSDNYLLEYGTPQGSVLGPLLYTILTNDMIKCMKFCSSVVFADDTTVYISGNNLKFLYRKMNEDLKHLTKWFDNNSLSLNVQKSCYILFRTKNKNPDFKGKIKVGNMDIKQVSHTKFLGVIIDEYLDWNMHIKHLLTKLASGIYSLKMAKNLLPFSSKRLLYFSNIQSHLTYGLSAWGSMITSTNLRKLKVQQNKAIRALFNLKIRTTLQPYYKKARILKIENLTELSLLKISYRYMNDILPQRILNLFEIPDHQYLTRNRNALQTPHHTLQIYNKCFLAKAPQLWLQLPDNIKNRSNTNSFTKSYLKYIIMKL